MPSLLARLFDLFGPDISVATSADVFQFTTGQSTVSLRTIISLDESGKRILSIGEEPSSREFALRVDVFDGIASAELGLAPDDLLEAFLRFGVARVTGRRILIRPRLTFLGAHSLARPLGDNYQDRIRRAAAKAGARECVFAV